MISMTGGDGVGVVRARFEHHAVDGGAPAAGDPLDRLAHHLALLNLLVPGEAHVDELA
jgi:hypothetical protein